MPCAVCGNELIADAAYCPRCGAAVEGATECDDYIYDAFISYRHLPTDRAAATKIQKAIEGYRIPKQLQELAGRARLGKCFRDEDELPTSASLSDQIESALKRSRYLVVVCTPQTRESLWVMREVEYFASYHGRDHILIALAGGEPDESFPPLMLSQLRPAADGTMVDVPAEPLGADLRDLSRKKFDVEKLRIISTLVGCSFDDLRQRARLRRNRIIAAVSSAITVVSTAFGGFSTYQQHRIEQSYHQIQLQQSEFLATESADLLASGDRYQAVQVALAALPLVSASPDRPYVPAVQLALEQSLGIYPGDTLWKSLYSQTDLSRRGPQEGPAYRGDGLEAIIASDRFIEIRRTETGDLVCRFDAEAQLGISFWSSTVYSAMKFAGDGLVVVFNDVVACFSVENGELLWSLPARDVSYSDLSLAVSPDGATAAIAIEPMLGSDELTIQTIDARTGEITRTVHLPGYVAAGRESSSFYEDPVLAFSPDGSYLAVGSWGNLYRIDLSTGAYETRTLHFDSARGISFVDGYLCVVSWDSAGTYFSMPACLEVFDAQLAKLWEYSATVEVPLDIDSGGQYYNSYGVYGTWNYFRGDDEQLVVLFGNDLLLLDAKTGKKVLSIPSDSSYLDCLVAQSHGQKRLFAVMGNGKVIARIPYESNSGKGGTVTDDMLCGGYLRYGDLFEMDGRVYCSVWSEVRDKRVVYRVADNEDMLESRPFTATGDSELKSVTWNGPTVCLRTEDSAIFIDSTTLEPALTVSLDETHMPLLDLESSSNISIQITNGSDAFISGRTRKDRGGSSGENVFYRIDGEDGSISEVARSREGGYLVQWKLACDTDLTEMLMIVTESGTMSYVDCISEEGELLHSFEYPNVKDVWSTSGGVIVCSDNDTDTTGAFALVNIDTGEASECDLAGYKLGIASQCDTHTSLSKDGLLFACVCSDGALRMFDTVTGTLLWETFETPPIIQNMLIAADGNVFVQDSFGRCVLVSGLTGEVIKASSTPLPPIVSMMFREESNEVLAYVREPGMSYTIGLAVISFDEETFGPLSLLYDTLFISSGQEGLFLYRDSITDELFVARKLSLDELIVYGYELTAGHELTDAERHLYQLGEQENPAELLSQATADVR